MSLDRFAPHKFIYPRCLQTRSAFFGPLFFGRRAERHDGTDRRVDVVRAAGDPGVLFAASVCVWAASLFFTPGPGSCRMRPTSLPAASTPLRR